MSDDTITLTKSTTPRGGAAEVTVPRSLGPVRLIREIGRGGMGVVYLGRHEMLGRDVAVKFLLNAVAGADDPGFERFLTGARAAARVRHEGLTTVHHADVIDGVPYLVMEYVDGPTLSDVLKQGGALSASAALAVLDQMLAAVSALHDQGIIHRDIKPSNILLDRSGRVLVTDFGLACDKARAGHGGAAAGPAGTPAYMAPELFEGEVSPRSDVYALGITAFELLSGDRPFGGPTLDQTRRQHVEVALPVASLHERGIDRAVIEILERAAHKSAMFRYKSAAHLREALRSTGSTPEIRAAGSTELQRLVLPGTDGSGQKAAPSTSGKTPSSSYFDRLAELATDKRATPGRPVVKDDVATVEEAGERPSGPTVAEDLACIRCGYNLRGLAFDGRCPECGTPVERSRRGDLLAAADSHWLSGVCRGVTLIGISVMAALASFAALLVLMPLLAGTSFAVDTLVAVTGMTIPASAVVLLLGVVALTRPDPRLALTEQPMVLRRVIRSATIAALVLIVADRAVELAGMPAWITTSAALGKTATFLVGTIAAIYYLAHLGDRIPQPKLTRSTRSMALKVAILTVIVVVGTALFRGVRPASPGAGVRALQIAVGVCVLAWMVYAVRLVGLIYRYRGVLRPCLAEALERDRAAGVEPVGEVSDPSRGGVVPQPPEQPVTTAPVFSLPIDLTCMRCGYNLRSLSAASRCPECNAPVSDSLRPDRLMFSDPAWLTSVSRGITVILWTLVTLAALIFGGIATMAILVWTGTGLPGQQTVVHTFQGGRATGSYNIVLDIGDIVLSAAFSVALGIGVLRSAQREPGSLAAGGAVIARKLSRVAGAVTIAAGAAPLLCFSLVRTTVHKLPNGVLVGPAMPALDATLTLAEMVGFAVMTAAYLYWLSGLARRFPRMKLARWSRAVGVIFCASVIASVGSAVWAILRDGVLPVALRGSVNATIVVSLIAIFVLLVAHRRTLRRLIPQCVSYEALTGEMAGVVGVTTNELPASSGAEEKAGARHELVDIPLDGWLSRTRLRDLPEVLLLVLVLGAFITVVGLFLAGVAKRSGSSGWWVLAFWVIVLITAAAVYGAFQELARRRVRSMVGGLEHRSVSSVAVDVMRYALRRHNPNVPVRLVKELVAERQVGHTFRTCPSDTATRVEPIAVPFEPIALDEADAAFVAFQSGLSSLDDGSQPPVDGSDTEENLTVRRVRRNVLMKGGWVQVVIFGSLFAMEVVRAIRRWQWSLPLFLWGFALGAVLFEPANWWRMMRRQWLLVPSGLVVRRVRGLSRGWTVHLFERATSVLCVCRFDRRKWRLTVGDAERCETTITTKKEIDVLLAAWLSPLDPPLRDRLTDLA